MAAVQNISLQQLADIAGLSKATVSRALRNDPRQSRATCQRLQNLASEMGYRSHPMVSALMARIRGSRETAFQSTIALLNTGRDRHAWRECSWLARFLDGAGRRVKALNYALDEIWLGESGMNDGRLRQILDSRGISGVLVMPSSFDPVGLDFDLQLAGYAAATTGYSIKNAVLQRSCVNFQHLIELSFHQLHRRGYRRIGLVANSAAVYSANGMLVAAYLTQQQSEPIERRLPVLLFDQRGDAANCGIFNSWFSRNLPDVIIDGGSSVLSWLTALGWRIPLDLGYVNLDLTGAGDESFLNSVRTAGLVPGSISGFDVEWQEVGKATIDLIVDQINRNECGGADILRNFLVAGNWREGATLRPPSGPNMPCEEGNRELTACR